MTNHNSLPAELPKHGYSRASQLLPFLPFGATTLWNWSKSGKFPKPVKLSSSLTAWSNEDVHLWFQKVHEGEANV